MKVYHGSSVLFDRFDLAHALEGDGKCKFGFGVYVTEGYGSAALYAFNKARPENKDYYVYTLEIPDKDADNCLSLLKGVQVNDSIITRVESKLGIAIPAEARAEGIPFRKYVANLVTGNIKSVKQMTGKATVSAEKAASDFFLSIGVTLIEWPRAWNHADKEKYYVVLNDNLIKITRIDKVELDKKHHLIPGSEIRVK